MRKLFITCIIAMLCLSGGALANSPPRNFLTPQDKYYCAYDDRRIVDYKVVYSEKVKKHLDKGWVLFGQPFANGSDKQAIVLCRN